MNCIFCQSCSDASISVEHIIPESLGNTDYVLPRGWVCDTCNNYMARKIEGPFLDGLHLVESRFAFQVPNKRGRIPPRPGLHPASRTNLELFHLADGEGIGVVPASGEDQTRWETFLATHRTGAIFLPAAPLPEDSPIVARFVGKVGLEALAHRLLAIPNANAEVALNQELTELRQFVRWNRGAGPWPINIRRLYPADHIFHDSQNNPYQVSHEFDILVTPTGDYYIVLALFGVEYAMNLGARDVAGYTDWLTTNNSMSPLYVGRNAEPGVVADGSRLHFCPLKTKYE